jgi:general secretion pathway protein J
MSRRACVHPLRGRRCRASHGQSGFTLVELLLAVTLLGLLLALAYGGLRAASRASDSGQQVLEETSRLRITHQFIRKQFNLMLPLGFEATDEEPPVRVTFVGDRDRVIFVGPMPGYLARGGPQVQQFELREGARGLQLEFSHAPLQEFERERLLDRDPVVLLDGLSGGGFSYRAAVEEGDDEPAEWVESWEEQAMMPESVRLDIAFGEDTAVRWPALVASARLHPSAVVPGSGSGDTYAERIQQMIRNQGGQNRRERDN